MVRPIAWDWRQGGLQAPQSYLFRHGKPQSRPAWEWRLFGRSSANRLVCIQTQIHDAIAARMVRAAKEHTAAGNLRSRLRSGTADRAQQTLDFQKRLSILYCD
jgi:DNA-binding sugar fermentation-stimulating protein